MLEIDDIVIYGETCTTKCPRAGTISFNVKSMDHGLVAAALNDYFNIAVRNECFCAHPYVEKMLEMTHREQIVEAKENIRDNNDDAQHATASYEGGAGSHQDPPIARRVMA